MPFSLKNAPSAFQRAVNIALSQFKWKSWLIYINDVVVFSAPIEEHIMNVEQVLTTIGAASTSPKLIKCEFFHEFIKYLDQKPSQKGSKLTLL